MTRDQLVAMAKRMAPQYKARVVKASSLLMAIRAVRAYYPRLDVLDAAAIVRLVTK